MKHIVCNDFDECAFDCLITVASVYGKPIIYCSYQFAQDMLQTHYDHIEKATIDSGFAKYKGIEVILVDTEITDPTTAWIATSELSNQAICFYTNTSLVVNNSNFLDLDENTNYLIQNISEYDIFYRIPEDGLRRIIVPNETRKICGSELKKLNSLKGGYEILTLFAINEAVQEVNEEI